MTYNQNYLYSSLLELQSAIGDVSKWSVYNDDKYNEEVYKVQTAIQGFSKLVQKDMVEKNVCDECGTELVETITSQDIDGNRTERNFTCPKCE